MAATLLEEALLAAVAATLLEEALLGASEATLPWFGPVPVSCIQEIIRAAAA